MKEQFKEVHFRPDSRSLIETCNQIINNYLGQGLRLTLRQLYYQLVTRNIIPNREQAYKGLGNLVSDGRLCGLIDWGAIEDRVRVPRTPNEFTDLKHLVEVALRSYRLPRWEGQDYYVELWVEKDALSGVLAPLANEYHITLMVNRGYSSQSAMYEAAGRFVSESSKKLCKLLYLGDHDPSGEDMVRDIQDRLNLMALNQVDVEKIALTMDQVTTYNPPPNPAKMTDSRARNYVAVHGASSWEVDALPPEVLQRLVRVSIEEYLDSTKMDKIKEQEEVDKQRLRGFVESL